MKKKLYHLIPIFVLLFSFTSFVYADSITLSGYYDYFDTDLPFYLSNYSSLNDISSHFSYPGYLLYYRNADNMNMYSTSDISSYYFFSNGSSFYLRGLSQQGKGIKRNNLIWQQTFAIGGLTEYNFLSYKGMTYSDFNFYFSSFTASNNHTIDSIILPSFTSTYYSCDIPSIIIYSGDKIPTYYDVYYSYCVAPPDDTPLLTSFFSITIEKLQYITEYFSSNYIYLSIFVIFIIVSIILIIKRRLF